MEFNNNITLSEEQQEALYQKFAQRYQAENSNCGQLRITEFINIPSEIWDELNSSSRNTLQTNSRQFTRDTQKYNAGSWKKTPVLNKPFMVDLKKHQVDAKQVITSRYDDSDKLRIAGRSATEIYEGLRIFMKSGS